MIELRMSALDSTASAMSACEWPTTPAANLAAESAALIAMPRKVARRLRLSRSVGTAGGDAPSIVMGPRGRPSRLFHERRQQFDRQRNDGRGVPVARDFADRLQIAQLQRDGLAGDHGGGLHKFFRRLKLAFGCDDLGPSFPLRLRLTGHG